MPQTTHETRDHPKPEDVPEMTTSALHAYIEREVDFLEGGDQRRIPAPVATAVREALLRAGRDARALNAIRKAADGA
jgi:hypothetical protein